MSSEIPQMQVQELLARLQSQRRTYMAEIEKLTAAIETIERAVAEYAAAESAPDVSASDAQPSTEGFVGRQVFPEDLIARGWVTSAIRRPDRTLDQSVGRRPDRTWDETPRRVPERSGSVVKPKSLSGLTQFDALIQLAKENEGIIRVAKARDRFIRDGLTKGSPRNVYTNIHHQLRKSDQFEQVGSGEFRLVLPAPTAIGPAQPDEDGRGSDA